MCVDDSYSEWCLGRLAQRVREGWIYVDISPNNRCLIRPDRNCNISSCPQRGTVHRHQPTLADREEAYDYITDWLALEFRREEERKAIIELERIYALVDPRPSTPSDLRAEAQRLICTGQMPSLDELLNAVAKTRSKYHNQIIAARKTGRKRG